MLGVIALSLPASVGLFVLVSGWRQSAAWLCAAANCGVLILGIALASKTVHGAAVIALWGYLRVDALGAFMVVVIGAVAVLASSVGVRYVRLELDGGRTTLRRAKLYCVLVQAFITTMLAAVLSSNLGVLWVAIEATTITTTFLVGHRRTRGSLEASWKYIVICTVGIGMAFLGTILIYLAGLHQGLHSFKALDWTALMANAHRLDPGTLRLGFALIVLGYGTKVGLAPMHSWLPDAHGEAPAPVSALMSGVLLTVAFYAILRFKAIVDIALGTQFPRILLVIFALSSLAIAASLLISQGNYKRMLAYSSIEHMGLIALGAAAGIPLAIAAVLLHILGHGLAKSVLFLASGEILEQEGSTQIADIRALIARRPALGGIFGFGLLALLGVPPFSLFSSELLMLRAEFKVGLGWAAGLALVAMAVIFASVTSHSRQLLLGSPSPDSALFADASGDTDAASAQRVPSKTSAAFSVPLVAALIACACVGVLAWPLSSLLAAAAHVVAL